MNATVKLTDATLADFEGFSNLYFNSFDTVVTGIRIEVHEEYQFQTFVLSLPAGTYAVNRVPISAILVWRERQL